MFLKKQIARLILIFVGTLSASQGLASLEMVNLTLQQVKNLQSQFAKAQPPQTQEIQGKSYDCRLYGMRSRMYSKEKKNFYRFEKKQDIPLKNSGAQIIPSYKFNKSTGLIGSQGPIKDVIRRSDSRTLISELTLPRRSKQAKRDLTSITDKDRIVIAYSVCNKSS